MNAMVFPGVGGLVWVDDQMSAYAEKKGWMGGTRMLQK